jgi:CIC family chloride channel protein
VAISIVTGVLAAVTVSLFGLCLDRLLRIIDSLGHPASIAMPFIAAVVVGLLILRKVPYAGGEGVQLYISAVNLRDGRLSKLGTVLRFPVTLITLTIFGSGGVVGPLAKICAGAGGWMTSRTVSRSRYGGEDDLSFGAICGFSGAISAIFHAPLAAGLYATEVLRRESIRYTDLFVALLSAVVSYVTSSIILGQDPFFTIEAPKLELSAVQAVWLPVAAVAGGFAGMLYTYAFRCSTSLFHKIPGRQPNQVIAAALPLSAAIFLGMGWALHTSPGIYSRLATGEMGHVTATPLLTLNLALTLILIILAKTVLTTITIGSGMSAGFTGPLIIIGMTLGALVSIAAGADPASPVYYGLMACGMASLLSTTLNIPLAAIALTTTLFGTSYILPAVTGSSIAFILFKSSTIYHYDPESGSRPAEEGGPHIAEGRAGSSPS